MTEQEAVRLANESPWISSGDGWPDVKQLVLLLWPVPGIDPIIRLGSILHKPWGEEQPIWKFELDYGDAGAWVYSDRKDEQPSYWMPIPALHNAGYNITSGRACDG